ncbi:RNA polymerase sigma factor [Azonexus sp.]|uniref:RNA polymerase sigma factor n=1 Tax=Azonexus sp. TaxID=1872668 RepID=UPI0027BADEC7|nr:RNA polymerase sigma factor [Azonexus sp.]
MPDHRSFVAALYQQYFDELSRFLTRHVGCRELAADLTHELFLRLLSKETTSTGIRHQRGFLFRCARNLATEAATSSRWRRSTVDETATAIEECHGTQNPERQTEDKQALDRLLTVVLELPPRCRDAFILHKFEGMTYGEVAEHMGISVGAVEKHMARALQACRAATR